MFNCLTILPYLPLLVLSYNFTQPNVGFPCRGVKGNPGIKYFYDSDTNEIFPFYYKGCGGDSNRFETRNQAPVRADDMPCPGYPDSNGSCNIHNFNGQPLKNCPKNFYCVMSWTGMGGYCCDAGARDRSLANKKAPMCLFYKKKPVTHRDDDRELTLIGRNCTHEFCPGGSRCYQGEFYGYCCLEK